jgi:hypothetical protein
MRGGTSVQAVLLTAFGLLTVATGTYFMALRPPLLPEDLRYTALDASQVSEALLPWLSIVFRTFGGFIVGLGLSVLGQAAVAFSGAAVWARRGMAAGLLFAFGSLLASNVQIHSDFLWFIAALFLGAAASAWLLLASQTPRE